MYQLADRKQSCLGISAVGSRVCEFLMLLLSFSSFLFDWAEIVMIFFGIGLWEETSWQDFHVNTLIF